MKRLLCGTAAGLMLASIVVPATAQLQNYIDTPQRVATYSATVVGFTPAATATDFFTITGSATTVVRVKHVNCSGTSTANGTTVVGGIVRKTADLTGTPVAVTAIPHDSGDAAATAVVENWTANPGTLGSAVGTVRVSFMGTTVVASSAPAAALDWDFGHYNDKEIVLRGVAQSFNLNNNSVAWNLGATLSCYVEWTESSF